MSVVLTDHLIVDEFLRDPMQSELLSLALESGLIDQLASTDFIDHPNLCLPPSVDKAGADFFIASLVHSGVLERSSSGNSIGLSARFQKALPFRDLLEVKLSLARLVAADFSQHRILDFLAGDETFFRESRLFELFDYSRCHEITPQNCMATSRWMQLTTTLTRYESLTILDRYRFDEHKLWVDVGGNSGELAAQVVARHRSLHATVFDLPVVCEVGRKHLRSHPDRSRIHFHAGDFRADAIPRDVDLITCKSLLHDWPIAHVNAILRQAFDSLLPGGQLVIFEREQCDDVAKRFCFGMLPVLMFFRSYRPPEIYQTMLASLGFGEITYQQVMLDWPFAIITATKP
jgi:SAM-dependent methyltransferase